MRGVSGCPQEIPTILLLHFPLWNSLHQSTSSTICFNLHAGVLTTSLGVLFFILRWYHLLLGIGREVAFFSIHQRIFRTFSWGHSFYKSGLSIQPPFFASKSGNIGISLCSSHGSEPGLPPYILSFPSI